MWKNKVHYYLRFTLGMTRSEILGLLSLFIFLLLADIFSRWIASQSQQQMTNFSQTTYWTKTLIEMEKSNQPLRTNSKRKSPYYYVDHQSYKSTFSSKDLKRDKKQVWQIDINQADSLAWIALPGIGPAFAKRILAYRDKLGGFYRTAQLKEVYGLDTLWINEHSSQFHVGKGVFRHLYINRSDWKEFRHPYLPYRQANLILNYRKQHGLFQNWEDLKKVQQLDEAVWQRLSPYLSFEP